MKKISPVNGHLLIEPIKHEGFIATERESYEEIGVVVEVSQAYIGSYEGKPQFTREFGVNPGDKVYFDSWLAKKYPKEGGDRDDFFWLVKWEDVAAVEYVEQKVSE